jgi:hypothetical protein
LWCFLDEVSFEILKVKLLVIVGMGIDQWWFVYMRRTGNKDLMNNLTLQTACA